MRFFQKIIFFCNPLKNKIFDVMTLNLDKNMKISLTTEFYIEIHRFFFTSAIKWRIAKLKPMKKANFPYGNA